MVRGPTRRAGTGSVPRSNQRSAVLGWTPLARAHSLSFIAIESTYVRPFAPTYPLTTNCSEPSWSVSIFLAGQRGEARLAALAVLLRQAAADPHRAEDRARPADQHRAGARDQRHAHHAIDLREEGRPAVVEQVQRVAVAVPDRGPDRLRLRDLRRQRRRPVHAGKRLQVAALVDDRHRDPDPELVGVLLRAGDDGLGLFERQWHGRQCTAHAGRGAAVTL